MEANSTFSPQFLRAVETEPVDRASVRGASGLDHPVRARGIDRARRRIVLVTDEHDARAAAIAQMDIQNALSGFQVVLARPIGANLSTAAQALASFLGRSSLQLDDLQRMTVEENEFHPQIQDALIHSFSSMLGFGVVPLSILGQIVELIRQIRLLEPVGDVGDGA